MKVALCVPAYDGRVHDEHANSIAHTMANAHKYGIEIKLMIGRGCPVLPDVRNYLVAKALSEGCDKVWFVDSDIAWTNSIHEALNMLKAPGDIVAAVHQRKNGTWNGPANLVVQWGKMPPPADEETGLWEVERVATAFVVIDKSVFRRIADANLARPYLPSRVYPEERVYPFLRNYYWYDFQPAVLDATLKAHLQAIGYDGPLESIEGEDYYFCRQAQKAGCKILVDPRVELIHFDGCVQHNVSLKNARFEAEEKAA
mgnify:CR=1 FL=1